MLRLAQVNRLYPGRVDRHGLVLAVATLWILAHGTRVEEACLRGLARVWLQPLPGPDPPWDLRWVDPPGLEQTVAH